MTTIHVLPNPSGITSEEYRTDAFGIATCKFIKNMKKFGWDIKHYGHESSKVECTNYPVILNRELPPPEDKGTLLYHRQDYANLFCDRVDKILEKTKKPGDIVVSFYGNAHSNAVKNHNNLKVIEPSIGYPVETIFSEYRGFVSYAWMHYYYGTKGMLMNPNWFDEVIPNAFDPSEFAYNELKDDFFVFIGRPILSKGIELAIDITKKLNIPLIVASSGTLKDMGIEKPNHVLEIGYVNVEDRKALLAKAKALIAPTLYIEPFGNIAVEAQLSGTPVITTDWGGFSENVINGVTGFRCRDYNDFMFAAENVSSISAKACRQYAETNYNEITIHGKMDRWFKKILKSDFYYVGEY